MQVRVWLEDMDLEFEGVDRVRDRKHNDDLKIEKIKKEDGEEYQEIATMPSEKVKEWRVID